MKQASHTENYPEVSEAEWDGSRAYSPMLLRIYDLCVLGFNNRFVWRCPTSHLLNQYNDHVSDSDTHLDIGPGTGYFLRRAQFPAAATVALLDLNEHPLAAASARLRERGIQATSHVGSVLHPLPVNGQFKSVGASLLMHCVPGPWDSKGGAFRYIADVVTDDGCFFGSTVLTEPSTRLSRAVAALFNRQGAFHNTADDLAGLRTALEKAWTDVQVDMIGQMAVWIARGPRRTSPT